MVWEAMPEVSEDYLKLSSENVGGWSGETVAEEPVRNKANKADVRRKAAQALRLGLEREGYDVAFEATGEQAFFRATTETFDLILLDRMLPDRDGLEVLWAIHRWPLETPSQVQRVAQTIEVTNREFELLEYLTHQRSCLAARCCRSSLT